MSGLHSFLPALALFCLAGCGGASLYVPPESLSAKGEIVLTDGQQIVIHASKVASLVDFAPGSIRYRCEVAVEGKDCKTAGGPAAMQPISGTAFCGAGWVEIQAADDASRLGNGAGPFVCLGDCQSYDPDDHRGVRLVPRLKTFQ
jgi:hypothetical protein